MFSHFQVSSSTPNEPLLCMEKRVVNLSLVQSEHNNRLCRGYKYTKACVKVNTYI